MSLLLQALKKAETEKRRRAGLTMGELESESLSAASLPDVDSNAVRDAGLALVDADTERATVSEQTAALPDEVSDYPELNLLDVEPLTPQPAPESAQSQNLEIAPAAEEQLEIRSDPNPIEFAVPDTAEAWVDQSEVIQPAASSSSSDNDIAPAMSMTEPIITPVQPAPAPAAEQTPPPAEPPVQIEIPAAQKVAQAQAKSFFAAPKAPAGRGLLPWLVLGGAVLLAGMVAWFWWQYKQLMQPAAPALAVITPVVAPVASSPAAADGYIVAEQAANAVEKDTHSKESQPVAKPQSITPSDGNKKPRLTPTPIAAQYERNPAAQFIRQPANEGINAALLAAWQSYQQGDLIAAERSYRQVLASDPRQRDALLGMAAIAQQNDLPREAEAIYRRLLVLNPQDQAANAALLAMKSERLSNKEATLLGQADASDPVVLGQFYASQQRWSEAQEQFFAAYTANPNVADNAFNLAVSLDHLSQSRLALTYYRRALQATRGATFDRDKAQQRVSELDAAQAEQAERIAKP